MSGSTNTRELETEILQKELQLSNLAAVITEKNKMLTSFKSEVKNLYSALLNNRIKQLEEKNNQSLSQEEKDRLEEELQKATIEFAINFCDDYQNQKNIEAILANGLAKENGEGDFAELTSLRFYIIRCIFEQRRLEHLIAEHEHCLQELCILKAESVGIDAAQAIANELPNVGVNAAKIIGAALKEAAPKFGLEAGQAIAEGFKHVDPTLGVQAATKIGTALKEAAPTVGLETAEKFALSAQYIATAAIVAVAIYGIKAFLNLYH
jgi:hypothetical protein